MIKPPLILTLAIEKNDFNYFNSLRQKYFPAERNFIDAHLTLFHALANQLTVSSTVKEICSNQSAFVMTVKALVSIGNGVAFKIESPELMLLHKTLQNKWIEFLSNQDKQKLWPHITIQNKVPANEAKDLLNELQKNFKPFLLPAKGLHLWEYLNGPWKLVDEFLFSAAFTQLSSYLPL